MKIRLFSLYSGFSLVNIAICFPFFFRGDWYLNLCRELFTFWRCIFSDIFTDFKSEWNWFCGLIISIVKIIWTTCSRIHITLLLSSWILNKDKYGSIYHSQMTSAKTKTKKNHIEIDYMNIKLWNIRSLQVLLSFCVCVCLFLHTDLFRIWKLIQNAVSLILTFLSVCLNLAIAFFCHFEWICKKLN